MDKIYKVLVDILDLEAGFTIAGFDPTFFTSKNENENENSAQSSFVQKNSQVKNRI